MMFTDEEELLFAALLFQQQLLLILLYIQNESEHREHWVQPIIQGREQFGEYNLVRSMYDLDEENFQNYLHMDRATFDELIFMIGPHIHKMDTNWRTFIKACERLAITLRFLATGDSQATLALSYRVGRSTVANIISETCSAIWEVLMPRYLKAPSSQAEWRSIASDFYSLWNFPMCIGAMDGKHIMIQAPANSGSEFLNNKGFHSIVLLAVCDAQYCFTFVDIGKSGHPGDGGIFANSELGKNLLNHTLNIPPPDSCATGEIFPYCLVADAAFPLRTNLMRPYPRKNLKEGEKIFNYRLSRARRMIENTFGIMSSRWRIFKRPISAQPDKAVLITKAACCLHNFLQSKNRELSPHQQYYCPPGYMDQEDRRGNITPGSWRSDGPTSCFMPLGRAGANSYAKDAASIRDNFRNYFLSNNGLLSWQADVVNRL